METDRGWKVEKRVNLGDILTMLGMMSSLLVFVGVGWLYLHTENARQDERITIVETRQTDIRREIDKNQQQVLYRFDHLEALIGKVDDKLDKKADK